MKTDKIMKMLAAPALAMLALSGCATNFNADVARFQQLPAPSGQTFTVVADEPDLAGGLEFSQYADRVAAHLAQVGYRPAAGPGTAQLVVRMSYDVDRGRERIRSTGFYNDPWYRGYGWNGFGWPGYGGFYRQRFIYGFHDPFLFGPSFNDIDSYTVYTSILKLRIDRASDGQRLFEGTASAQSLSNNLTYLVPNLVEAMFKDFPGQSGEVVRVTIPPEPKSTATRN